MQFSARFYTTPAAIDLYRDYVTQLIHAATPSTAGFIAMTRPS